jgi:hypothetical protein
MGALSAIAVVVWLIVVQVAPDFGWWGVSPLKAGWFSVGTFASILVDVFAGRALLRRE